MRLHYQRLTLLFVGCVLAEPAWAAPSMPVPELGAPERGSLAGSLSRLSYGPADLMRGAFTLPGPFEAPQDRGPLLAQVVPSYSPEAGLSEWGMGWNTNLAIVRTAVIGDINYEADEFVSPWGLLTAGNDGHYYPAGMRAAVRLTREAGGWTAVLADGTRLAFTHRIDTWAGTYAWYLRVAENPLGDRTEITYQGSQRGRPYVSEVSYGGRGRADYRLRFEYETLSAPFTSYLSGEAWTLDKRVRAVHVETKHAHSGRFEPRWRYELSYEKSPLGPAFYLASVTRVHASGAEEPASRYTYDLGTEPLDTATFAHVPALDPFTTTGHGLRMASFVDLDRDGVVDLEHPTYYKRFRLVDGKWQAFPLPEVRRPFRHCRNEPDMLNQPRLLAYLTPEARSAQVLVRFRHSDGTRLILCTEEGWRIMEFELREDWRGTPLVDMNRDLRPDMVRLERGTLQMVRNLSGRGDFDFFESFGRPLLPAFTPNALWTVDVNGDGIVDIIGRNGNKLFVWYGQGEYGFVKQGQELRLYTPTNLSPVNIAAPGSRLYFVDLNRDGLADALLTDKSRVRVFYNQGDRFLEHRVKALDPLPREALVTNGVGEALAAVADLTGDGNVDFVYQHDWKAWSLSLVRTGTGLMQAADDGKGTVLEFRYSRAKPQPGVPDRPALLSELVVSVSGKEPVTYRYEYEHPIVHSRGKFLLGYRQIRRHGPELDEEVGLRYENDSTGVVESVRQRDKRTPGLERYVTRQFTKQQFAGVRWLRPDFEQTGWRPGEGRQDPHRGTTVTTVHQAFEADGRCPTRSVVFGPSGELVRETIRASIPQMADALHCLSSFERETGRHADGAHDAMQEQEILRNAYGQITEVRQVGDGEMLTAYSVDYDAARRVRAVHQPGRGTVQITYDERTGLIRDIVSADGVVRRASARHPVSDAFTALTDDRGPGGVLTSFYRYDPFERLEASWQNIGGSSAAVPLRMLRYAYPSRAGPGAVSERALVDAAAAIVRDQVEYVAADGTPLGTATRIPEGWAFSEMRAYSRRNHTELAYRRPVLPGAQEPMHLGYDELYSAERVFLRRTDTTGFGDAVNAWTIVQQGALHTVHSERAVVDGLLVTTAVENEAQATAMATDAAGHTRWTRDEIGAITSFTYDVWGRLVRIELPDGQTHRARYDRLGRIARIERDGLGAITYEYAPSTGLLATRHVIEANGAIERTVAYTYDAAGRLVRETHTQAGASEPRTVEYEYDGGPGQRGRLTRVRGAQHEAWFRYNPDGTVAHTVIELAGWRSASIAIEYYAGGQIRRTTRVIRDLQQGGAILEELTQDFLYDSHGRLHALIVNGNQLATIVYDAEGRIDRIQLASGDMVVYSYDPVTHQPNAYWHDAGEWNAGVEWTLDARGHIIREAFSVNGAYRNRNYLYDPRGFLTESADDSHTARYTYTAAGLIATAEDELGLRTVHRGTAQSLLVGTTAYAYDDLGRVVRKGDIELAYGPDGQLAVARRGNDQWTYHHDEHGNRLLKQHNGQPVAAYLDGSYITANRIITPVRIAGRLIGVLEGSQFHLLAVDPRGTVLSDRDGTPRPASPYGVRSTRPDLAEALDYIEAAYDPVLGTVRMGVRDYDPILGQFWTPDPLYFAAPELCAADPAQCNLYTYASNNPLSFIDPSGPGPDLFQRSESESYCDFNPVQCQAASGPTVGELARRGYDLGGQIAVNVAYGVLSTLFCGLECSEAGENAAASKGPLDDLGDAAVTALAFTNPFKGASGSPREAAASVDNAARWAGSRFTSPKVFTNRHGQLTNGRYVLDDVGMAPHTTGSLAKGKSQFLYRVNEKQLTLDAAAYADEAGLWVGNKAKVILDDFIGVHAGTGQRTNVLNIYRTDSGFVHAAPGSPL